MKREVNAIWNGYGSDGMGYLSTKSGAIDKFDPNIAIYHDS